jgi:hypothetical protein
VDGGDAPSVATVGFQPAIVPSSVAKMNAAGPLVVPSLTTNAEVLLKSNASAANTHCQTLRRSHAGIQVMMPSTSRLPKSDRNLTTPCERM